jgi:hypothetical protein
MRKVVVSEFVSLDGVMEAPDKWHFQFWHEEMGDNSEVAALRRGTRTSKS